jgi:hypothetical protein
MTKTAEPVAPETLTDAQIRSGVLAAMDPNGAVIKLWGIVEQCAIELSCDRPNALYRSVESTLRRLRAAGIVELVKGRGAGYRLINARASKET